MSFRASAHTGVGIPCKFPASPLNRWGLPHQPAGWFAMTRIAKGRPAGRPHYSKLKLSNIPLNISRQEAAFSSAVITVRQ